MNIEISNRDALILKMFIEHNESDGLAKDVLNLIHFQLHNRLSKLSIQELWDLQNSFKLKSDDYKFIKR